MSYEHLNFSYFSFIDWLFLYALSECIGDIYPYTVYTQHPSLPPLLHILHVDLNNNNNNNNNTTTVSNVETSATLSQNSRYDNLDFTIGQRKRRYTISLVGCVLICKLTQHAPCRQWYP